MEVPSDSIGLETIAHAVEETPPVPMMMQASYTRAQRAPAEMGRADTKAPAAMKGKRAACCAWIRVQQTETESAVSFVLSAVQRVSAPGLHEANSGRVEQC